MANVAPRFTETSGFQFAHPTTDRLHITEVTKLEPLQAHSYFLLGTLVAKT